MSALDVKHLRAGYGQKIILEDISFTVQPREIRMILGASGCGKSTLLNNILKLEHAISGTLSFFGEEIQTKEPIPDRLRRRMGVLFQGGALLTNLTVAENVALPLRRSYPKLAQTTLNEIVADRLEKVHLLNAFYKFPSELSGGMRKRAALARAIAFEPELLFCDEPSAGLDPVTSRSLDELLLELRDTLGVSVIIVSHELESIKTITDKFIYLQNGNILMDGTLDEGLHSDIPVIHKFFAREHDNPVVNKRFIHFEFEN
ncbi:MULTISPECIES: ATP-binding cassette domain-containing protein [Hallerella]|uniref:Phospholipid/cholesterol/gamma-HCH transport system ATP-binding protein n=1 Tax=Hallerella succinigenes TaxID=1896222 RepID=A0A2M9A3F1_9BACT|nr:MULTISPECIES: ATP-binding cassette domain-containing protein [Hallerella]MCI6872781.1 ATP-binding cassette domain-containing protein [Hallerella sp.]MDD6091227.1 ATP-binding cassette domain-containing protein [Hallerella succinigenes]PJJ40252.1 phospholipid/cholesterol/gamma-HCH transport system ATP-binding protein [Hallerella succinigenes]